MAKESKYANFKQIPPIAKAAILGKGDNLVFYRYIYFYFSTVCDFFVTACAGLWFIFTRFSIIFLAAVIKTWHKITAIIIVVKVKKPKNFVP